jgi:hypothetical protein
MAIDVHESRVTRALYDNFVTLLHRNRYSLVVYFPIFSPIILTIVILRIYVLHYTLIHYILLASTFGTGDRSVNSMGLCNELVI